MTDLQKANLDHAEALRTAATSKLDTLQGSRKYYKSKVDENQVLVAEKDEQIKKVEGELAEARKLFQRAVCDIEPSLAKPAESNIFRNSSYLADWQSSQIFHGGIHPGIRSF